MIGNKTYKPLFSEHYLTHRIQQHEEWGQDVTHLWQRYGEIYESKREVLPNYNESQTEQAFIQPILREILGFEGAYTVQTTVRQQGRVQRPDYTLFADAASKMSADGEMGNQEAFYGRAVAIADAKYWQRPLNQMRRADVRDAFKNSNPSFQIVNYLVGTGVAWGILTNGRHWRLYHREGSTSQYYEVDLVAMASEDEFRYFYLFFRREAFAPDVHGNCFLDRVKNENADYVRAVGDELKRRVFSDVFPLLAGGFVTYRTREGKALDNRLIYEATLSLLYKLLFLLYGEARTLLPVDNRRYRKYSLTQMMSEITAEIDRSEPFSAVSARLYSRLLELFKIIDRGDVSLGLPRYNGGLFHFDLRTPEDQASHAENHFLTQNEISDEPLAHALHCLARYEGERIDYGFLDVRDLGAIYEGLLEYKLVVVDAQAGQVELENDKGERKATGSYYTPDYIVKYIVKHTLGPILRQRSQRFAALMEQTAHKRHELERQRHPGAVLVVRSELKRLNEEAREVLLDIKICDPAMGSGHFLVEAVNFLTIQLITILDKYPDDNPVLEQLEQIRQQIQRNMAQAGIEVDEDRLNDNQLLQRVVMKRCIYGVDLNRMAVELAKVSLWLHTFTVGAPLSFLDHHLRCGNSLLGAMAQQAAEAMRQEESGQMMLAFMQGPFVGLLQAAKIMRGINLLSDATLADVAQSESLFTKFDEAAKPYKKLLDLYVMRHFANKQQQKQVNSFLLYSPDKALSLLRTSPERRSPRDNALLTTTRALYEEKRFFHWDLEFPEVFIDLNGGTWKRNGGFDVVVGNPPYVRQEELKPLKKYFKSTFAAYHGVADLYLYFFEQGIKLLRQDGRMAYISSGTFARANFANPFRQWLPKHANLEQLIDFGENQPFAEAEMVRPSIVVLHKGGEQPTFRTLFMSGTTIPDSLDEGMAKEGFECDSKSLTRPEWTFQPIAITRLFDKIIAQGTPLLEVVDGKMYRGVTTGFNEAFYIDQATRDKLIQADPNCAELIKPMLRGADLRPWYQKETREWLIFTRRGVDINNYPAIKAHLEQFRAQLEPRPKDWNNKQRWKGRKPGSYQWYEIQDTVAYHREFENPKIIWPDISKLPRFSWDDDGFYMNNTGYAIPTSDLSVLGILQSRVSWFSISQTCQPLRLRAGLWQYRLLPQFMPRLTIPNMSDTEREAIGQLALTITEKAKTRYTLHRKTRHRIFTDLGTPGKKLNNKLTAWWALDFRTFRKQLKKVFKQDIPLKERDEWEEWLEGQQNKHTRLTTQIIRLERDLNAHVYALFDLTRDEIRLIEESTKYEYGVV